MNFNKIVLSTIALISFSNILTMDMDSLDKFVGKDDSKKEQKKINKIFIKCVDLRPIQNSKNGWRHTHKCLDGIPSLVELQKLINEEFKLKDNFYYLVTDKTYLKTDTSLFKDEHNIKSLNLQDFNEYGNITLYVVITK